MKTHLSTSVSLESGGTCKTVVIKYDDALFFIVTDRDNLGTLTEVERAPEGEDEDIDVKILSGAGERAEAQLEISRMVADVVLFGDWTGHEKDKWVKLSRAKKLLISICLNKEHGAEEEQIIKKETLKTIIGSIKSLLQANITFFFE